MQWLVSCRYISKVEGVVRCGRGTSQSTNVITYSYCCALILGTWYVVDCWYMTRRTTCFRSLSLGPKSTGAVCVSHVGTICIIRGRSDWTRQGLFCPWYASVSLGERSVMESNLESNRGLLVYFAQRVDCPELESESESKSEPEPKPEPDCESES